MIFLGYTVTLNPTFVSSQSSSDPQTSESINSGSVLILSNSTSNNNNVNKVLLAGLKKVSSYPVSLKGASDKSTLVATASELTIVPSASSLVTTSPSIASASLTTLGPASEETSAAKVGDLASSILLDTTTSDSCNEGVEHGHNITSTTHHHHDEDDDDCDGDEGDGGNNLKVSSDQDVSPCSHLEINSCSFKPARPGRHRCRPFRSHVQTGQRGSPLRRWGSSSGIRRGPTQEEQNQR